MRAIRVRSKVRKSKNVDDFDLKERRDALSRLCFSSYSAYLKSDLWKSVRERVLERDQGKCCRCGEPATQVHHSAYDLATLKGDTLARLFSACGKCHKGSHWFWGQAAEIKPMSEKEARRRAKLEKAPEWVKDMHRRQRAGKKKPRPRGRFR